MGNRLLKIKVKVFGLEIRGERLSKRVRISMLVAAVLIVVIAAAVIIGQIIAGSRPQNKSVLVFRSGGEIVVRIDGVQTVVSDTSACEFKCDNESGRVFFAVDSAYSDGLYDLYYVEKQRSEIAEPRIIDYGIEKDFDVVSGKVYYLKKNIQDGAYDGCVCNVDKNKIEAFSANVEGIYPLDNCDELYFTKMHGNNRVLYKYSDGAPSEVSRDIRQILCYNKIENPHIIYEKKSQANEDLTELYIAFSESEPELICDNTFSVLYDYYTPSGNLYYFTSSEESVSWSYVISDQYAESDKSVIKPQRKDFLSFFGISAEYNAALHEYQDKLVRDEIRDALNQTMENGEFSAPVFTAFAYNSNGNFKLAENIDPQNVYTVSAFGEPKIIFESTEIVKGDTDMNTLVTIAQRSTMDEVIEYARSLVADSVKSNGMEFAAYGSSGAVSHELSGYDRQKTLFSFSRDGGRIFAFVRDTLGERLNLFTNSLDSQLTPSAQISVDTGISSYRFVGNSVLYLKTDVGKNTGDIYAYNGEKAVKLSNAASAFTVENSEDIIAIKGQNTSSAQPTADYYICTEDGEELIGNDIVVSSFKFSEDKKAAFIQGDNARLCVFKSGKTSSVADGVSEIILFE